MAREDVAELYRELRNSRFAFLPAGEHQIADVYAAVKKQYPHLCDDTYLCAENCSRGHQQAEWRHTTRKALWSLKSTDGAVQAGHATGYWRFTGEGSSASRARDSVSPVGVEDHAHRQR